MPPRSKKPIVTTKSSEKVLRKRASSSTLTASTPPNRRKLKINPPKHPGDNQDIDQEEEISVINKKDEGTKVSLYNILKKYIYNYYMNYDINYNIQANKSALATPFEILTDSQLLPLESS